MQSLKTFPAWAAASTFPVLAIVATLSSQVFMSAAHAPSAPVAVLPDLPAAAPAIRLPALPAAAPAIRLAGAPSLRLPEAPSLGLPSAKKAKPAIGFSEDSVRAQLKFETVRWGGKPVQTLDEPSRILLAKAAAEKAGLHAVGLSYRDVYGVIEAETSWIPRTGSSKNGTPNLGLAQFEPRTAAGLGVTDPSDPVQAVFGAAAYMKDGAKWASGKLRHLELSPEQHAAKLREGVSVYYNLSVKGRNKWDGLNAAELPIETQKHIRNAALGAMEAAQLSKLLNT